MAPNVSTIIESFIFYIISVNLYNFKIKGSDKNFIDNFVQWQHYDASIYCTTKLDSKLIWGHRETVFDCSKHDRYRFQTYMGEWIIFILAVVDKVWP